MKNRIDCVDLMKNSSARMSTGSYNDLEDFCAALTWLLTQNVAASDGCLKKLLPFLAGVFEFRSQAFYRLCE